LTTSAGSDPIHFTLDEGFADFLGRPPSNIFTDYQVQAATDQSDPGPPPWEYTLEGMMQSDGTGQGKLWWTQNVISADDPPATTLPPGDGFFAASIGTPPGTLADPGLQLDVAMEVTLASWTDHGLNSSLEIDFYDNGSAHTIVLLIELFGGTWDSAITANGPGGVEQAFGTPAPLAAGDLIRFERIGDNIKAFVNGVQLGSTLTVTGANTGTGIIVTDGRVVLNAGRHYHGTNDDPIVDDFANGELALDRVTFSAPA
jgi:hypothetical protein